MGSDDLFRTILVPWNPFKPIEEVMIPFDLSHRLRKLQEMIGGHFEVVSGTSTLNKLARGRARVGMLVIEDIRDLPGSVTLNARASYIHGAAIYGNAVLLGVGQEDVLPMPVHTTLDWLIEQLTLIVES